MGQWWAGSHLDLGVLDVHVLGPHFNFNLTPGTLKQSWGSP